MRPSSSGASSQAGGSTATTPLARAQSAPSLSAAFNLREYSLGRKKLATPESKRRAGGFGQNLLHAEISYTQDDLIGGNGAWRQRKAKVEFDKKAAEEEARRRQEKIMQVEMLRRKALREERRRRAEEEEKRHLREEHERFIRNQREKAERQRILEEKEQQRKEQEHRDWLARQPKPCEICNGSGKCQSCSGRGLLLDTFLVAKVSPQQQARKGVSFGRLEQGCNHCGGWRQNLIGELKMGDGRCTKCGGAGQIWPIIAKKSDTNREGPAHPRRRSYTQTSDHVAAAAIATALAAEGALEEPLSPTSVARKPSLGGLSDDFGGPDSPKSMKSATAKKL
jgi:hypothetical protein